jgi:hypothetical protein
MTMEFYYYGHLESVFVGSFMNVTVHLQPDDDEPSPKRRRPSRAPRVCARCGKKGIRGLFQHFIGQGGIELLCSTCLEAGPGEGHPPVSKPAKVTSARSVPPPTTPPVRARRKILNRHMPRSSGDSEATEASPRPRAPSPATPALFEGLGNRLRSFRAAQRVHDPYRQMDMPTAASTSPTSSELRIPCDYRPPSIEMIRLPCGHRVGESNGPIGMAVFVYLCGCVVPIRKGPGGVSCEGWPHSPDGGAED